MEDFFKTTQGQKYLNKQLPALIESNNRLAIALTKYAKVEEKKIILEKRGTNESKIN
jgi:hypothetical protein